MSIHKSHAYNCGLHNRYATQNANLHCGWVIITSTYMQRSGVWDEEDWDAYYRGYNDGKISGDYTANTHPQCNIKNSEKWIPLGDGNYTTKHF